MTAIGWPAAWDRTPPRERSGGSKFNATLGQTTKELVGELERMDVDDWRVSFGNRHRKSNGMPRHSANPDDPGFVLRWTKDGSQYAVACDEYDSLDANVRAIYLWVNETRMRGQRPVQTGEDEFAAARLPSGDGEGTVVAGGEITPVHEILGVPRDASRDEIKAAYRDRLKDVHPDHDNGSQEAFKRVKDAYEAMLNQIENGPTP